MGLTRWLCLGILALYGCVAFGGDDAAAVQALLDAAALSGDTVHLAPRVYLIGSSLTMPSSARISIEGAGGTVLKAVVPNISLLVIPDDVNAESGSRALNQLRLDGGDLPGVIGIDLHCATQTHLADVTVVRCDVGVNLAGTMECSLRDCTVLRCRIGVKLRQNPTGGGGNANVFDGMHLFANTVGFVGDSCSPYPMSHNRLTGMVVEGNALCGAAFFGALGRGWIVSGHFENNGNGGLAPLVLDGRTITPCALLLDNSDVSLRDAALFESCLPNVILKNNARLSMLDACVGCTPDADQIISEPGCVVRLQGDCALDGSNGYIGEWSGFACGSQRGALYGDPICVATDTPRNQYPGPNAACPDVTSVTGATASKAWDATGMGYVQRVVYGAFWNAATSGPNWAAVANRVAFTVFGGPGVRAGDRIVISLLCRAQVPTDLWAYTIGDVPGIFGPRRFHVGTSWTRLVLYGIVQAPTPNIYVLLYPVAGDGPTVDYARLMVACTAAGQSVNDLETVIRRGLFNDLRTVYAPAPPVSGPWKAGDRVMNSSATIGRPSGWECYRSGTPGLWKALPNL